MIPLWLMLKRTWSSIGGKMQPVKDDILGGFLQQGIIMYN